MQKLISLPPTDRVGRYPKHTFNIRENAFTAQPFMIAPVLPGETLENIFFESRAVSDPVVSPIIGWKKQYFFFYVRITDLLNDVIRDMFVDPTNTDLTATLGVAANDLAYYQGKGGIDYLKRATTRIVETYFRDQDETAAAYQTAAGIPMVQIRESNWMDSLTDKDVLAEGAAISSATDAGDLQRLMDAFEQLRAMGVANMTYEDWLRSYGIGIPQKDENKPEMLAQFSDFQYPSNTINASTGAPTSALSWVFKNGNRDRKFFKEPGFVVGISVTRPKVYFTGLTGNMAAWMGRAWDWAPNYLQQNPQTTLRYFAGDTGPLGDRLTAPDGYWVDMRDLLLYGDQFQNRSTFPANSANPADVPNINGLALPDGATFNRKYPTEAQAKSFFVDTATNCYVKQDGYCSLSIKGSQIDYTAQNVADV